MKPEMTLHERLVEEHIKAVTQDTPRYSADYDVWLEDRIAQLEDRIAQLEDRNYFRKRYLQCSEDFAQLRAEHERLRHALSYYDKRRICKE